MCRCNAGLVGILNSGLLSAGCGLPPGPGGLLGAAEGVAYLTVAALAVWSLASKLFTGRGLPQGKLATLALLPPAPSLPWPNSCPASTLPPWCRQRLEHIVLSQRSVLLYTVWMNAWTAPASLVQQAPFAFKPALDFWVKRVYRMTNSACLHNLQPV